MNDRIVALTKDTLARRQLEKAAEDLEAGLTLAGTVAELTSLDVQPVAVVVDLEVEGAVELAPVLKERWPLLLLVGYLTLPEPERWRSAQDAGFDLVSTRGSLGRQLITKAKEWKASPGGRRLRLFSVGEIAGRIGLVARLGDTPVGPLAVYHLGGRILAVQDTCPHAGALLSEGELLSDQAVITCPRHGSRFNLDTGERVRGPADDAIRTYRVMVEGTEAYIRLDV